MTRWMPAAFVAIYAVLPLFPAFIALTSVAYPGISVVPPGLAYGLLALIALLATYATAMLLRHREPHSQPLLRALLFWLACAAVSALAGFDPTRGLLFFILFSMGIVWHCALMRFYPQPGVAVAVFYSYLTSGTLAAALAVAMVVSRRPAALYALAHGRATGTFVLPGELAGYLIVLLPIAVTLALESRDRRLRMLAWMCGAVGLAALLLTYSRAGWIGFAAAATFVLFVRFGRTRNGRLAVVTVAATAAAALLLLFNSHHDPSEDYTRVAIWQAAVTIVDRFPLTGVGPFDFPLLYAHVRLPDGDATAFHAHSLYLTLLAETGVLGFGAFLWTCWRFVVVLRARLDHAPPEHAALALAVTAGLVGVAVQGLIDTVSIVIFGLWLPTLALALSVARYGGPRGVRT